MIGPVEVLANIEHEATMRRRNANRERARGNADKALQFDRRADRLLDTRAAMAELIEAASAGTPIKFQQSRPEVWLRFGGDESRRLLAALANVGSAS